MKRFFCVLLVLMIVALGGCSNEKKSARPILEDIMEKNTPLPVGEVYTKDKEIGEDGYLSSAMLRSMYGDDAEEIFLGVSDFAIYMSSFASPYEIAVFLCYSNTDAIRVEQMCRGRGDILAVAFRRTEFHDLYKNIKVERKGKEVRFIMVGEDLSEK